MIDELNQYGGHHESEWDQTPVGRNQHHRERHDEHGNHINHHHYPQQQQQVQQITQQVQQPACCELERTSK